ncbi:MAG: glycosyl hydrolase-related protein, partial [Chloroflexota bacterium]
YRSGESLIVRVYNITREEVRGEIGFGFPVGRIFRVNMAEEYQETLAIHEGKIQIEVRGAEVYTLKIMPE